MFKKSPKDFMTAYFAPYNAASYLLNDPEKRDAAMKTLERHSTGTFPSYFGLSWILTLRLLMVDTVVDTLGDIKYKIQTNEAWKNWFGGSHRVATAWTPNSRTNINY